MTRTTDTKQRAAAMPTAALVGPAMCDPQLGTGWAGGIANPWERGTTSTTASRPSVPPGTSGDPRHRRRREPPEAAGIPRRPFWFSGRAAHDDAATATRRATRTRTTCTPSTNSPNPSESRRRPQPRSRAAPTATAPSPRCSSPTTSSTSPGPRRSAPSARSPPSCLQRGPWSARSRGACGAASCCQRPHRRATSGRAAGRRSTPGPSSIVDELGVVGSRRLTRRDPTSAAPVTAARRGTPGVGRVSGRGGASVASWCGCDRSVPPASCVVAARSLISAVGAVVVEPLASAAADADDDVVLDEPGEYVEPGRADEPAARHRPAARRRRCETPPATAVELAPRRPADGRQPVVLDVPAVRPRARRLRRRPRRGRRRGALRRRQPARHGRHDGALRRRPRRHLRAAARPRLAFADELGVVAYPVTLFVDADGRDRRRDGPDRRRRAAGAHRGALVVP